MANVKDITTMCKAGNINEAYTLAEQDYNAEPQNAWTQREVGWVLYYMLKNDVENKDRESFYAHLNELSELNLLTIQDDSLIFNNVIWKLVELIKLIPPENTGELERIFQFLVNYKFAPFNGYSVLLKQIIKFDSWIRMVEFFEWWNIDNLMPEDYQPFKMENGRKIMSLAEQAYIAYSKALLKLNDKEKIKNFIPKIEKLMEEYPDMMYPGYFCGKLKLSLGVEREDALDIIMPFVRKKKTEFWVWQLLAEFYRDENDILLSCLLRAVHCKTQETFLGRVRIRLVSIYLQRKDYSRAKHHLDQVVRCYMQQGWHLPYEVQNWMREPWVNNAKTDGSDGIDYKKHTDSILVRGANTSIAIVTYVDNAKKRAIVVYADKKRANVPQSDFGIKVKEGALVELGWMPVADGGITVVGAKLVDRQALSGIPYIKAIEGKVSKRENNPFAFIKQGNLQCYIKPELVQQLHLQDNDNISVLAVFDYNKKKDNWGWNCVSITKK